MNDQGTIRQIPAGEDIKGNEISVSDPSAETLTGMIPRARREYYRCVKMGRTEEFALAAAQAINRSQLVSKITTTPKTNTPKIENDEDAQEVS
jgi:hypothetical protein